MSKLKIINGTLAECTEKINKLEDKGCEVAVVNARPLIETPHLLGSGTGHRLPQVTLWQMLLQYRWDKR